jgi:hypothetical protein
MATTTTIRTAAPIAQTPSALILAPQRLTRSLSDMTQLSFQKHLKSESFLSGGLSKTHGFQIRATHREPPKKFCSELNYLNHGDCQAKVRFPDASRRYVDKVFESIGLLSLVSQRNLAATFLPRRKAYRSRSKTKERQHYRHHAHSGDDTENA